jgi:dihydrofolate synthase/folylpolyglutamate synthase
MAFQYFKDEKVDIAVIETGMGGRLDSTNIITPLVSVITNISMDHMAFLGDTLPAIAAEKAGIIKPGVPIVIGETQAEVKEVFLKRAKEMKAQIYFADQNYHLSKNLTGEIIISSRDSISTIPDGVSLICPLKGIYQEKNFISSYQAVKLLTESGFFIQETAIRSGYKNVSRITGLRGRWEILSRKPRTICDVGHNEAGISFIIEQLKQEKFDRLHWVFGLVSDKDSENILKLLPENAIYYFCKANIPRGLDAEELKRKADIYGLNGRVYPSVKEAYHAAQMACGENDLIFIGGSTFIVAEVL